jgi:hypothetical protein
MNNTNEYISNDFKFFYDRKCKNDNSVACKINDNKIDEISDFIAHEIPKCTEIDITLDDIKHGKILSKGGFGYSYITALNNPSRKKIIKIAICSGTLGKSLPESSGEGTLGKSLPESSGEGTLGKSLPESSGEGTLGEGTNMNNLYSELKLHSEITNSKNNIFIKLYGYFIRNKINEYEYYDYDNDFKKVICATRPEKNGTNTTGCEIYMILEAGHGDLTKYIDDNKIVKHRGVSNALSAEKSYNINTLKNLLNFYKISKYFLENNRKIFIHNDLKVENIVYKSDTEFKIIDFGLSELSNKFFDFNYIGGTDYTYSLLYETQELKTKLSVFKNKGRIRSPLYDIFCICVAIFEFVSCDIYILYGYNNLYQRLDIIKDIVYNNNFTDEIRNFIKNLIHLTKAIYNFQQNNIKILLDTDNFNEYIRINNMELFIVQSIDGKIPPVYINTNNKLLDDYNYFDKIVEYYLGLP